MTGHEPIIAMRRRGKTPRYVWVSCHDDLPHPATVRIAPEDVPELLDLRFLVGLTALVEGLDTDPRVPRLASACASVANRVVCTIGHDVPYGYEVSRITDTDGAMTWPN